MFALVDATSFYASAEKVFDPSIRQRPVVVLTNNDGCVCALCPIAKQLGIPKFTPYFKIKALLAQHNVVIRSSNYELYADLSERMMNVIARFCDDVHVYSIDEAFLYFNNYQKAIANWFQYGHDIRRAIWQETRLPVGVGFGCTATLAKAANHAAKKLTDFDGVAVIENAIQAAPILQRMKVSDVWGVGGRLSQHLAKQQIYSAYQLAQQSPKKIRKQFSVVTERTVNELNGLSCLSWHDVKEPKKEIYSTRSFAQRVNNIQVLHNALSYHACIVAKKCRQQSSKVKKLLVFAASSPYDKAYYKRSLIYSFVVATDHSSHLAQAVSELLPHIYQQGINFYRCGVGAIDLDSNDYQQLDLFSHDNSQPELMQCIDRINQRYGDHTITLASAKKTAQWQMNRCFLSPQYTSNWRHIPKISC